MADTVLIVDDEIDLLRGLERTINMDIDSRVLLAENGERALEMVETEPVDAVLADINMPGMDGISLLRAIKSKDPSITVIIMTAYGTIERAVEAIKAGAYDFIQKPFDEERLIHLIKKGLGLLNQIRIDGASDDIKEMIIEFFLRRDILFGRKYAKGIDPGIFLVITQTFFQVCLHIRIVKLFDNLARMFTPLVKGIGIVPGLGDDVYIVVASIPVVGTKLYELGTAKSLGKVPVGPDPGLPVVVRPCQPRVPPIAVYLIVAHPEVEDAANHE